MSLPLTANVGATGSACVEPPSSQAGYLELPEPVSGNSEFDEAWSQGFKFLRFPPSLEVRYRQDKVEERLRLIRIGALFMVFMACILLMTDWWMVPDVFHRALMLRLAIEVPVVLFVLAMLGRATPRTRERLMAMMTLTTAAACTYVVAGSKSPLSAMYLIVLVVVPLFNGSAVRLPFWMALRVDLAVLAMFTFGVFLLDNPPWPVMFSEALVMVSTTIFTLFCIYRSEYEDRANWLLAQQQRLLQDEVAHTNGQLEKLSRFDPLTDLANRRYFDQFLQAAWQRAQRQGDEVALLMIDIDHFKAYNDHYGHSQGDSCIQAVAKAMTECLRKPEGLVARYGGEEFVVVLPGATLAIAQSAAERVRQGIARQHIAHAASPVSGEVSLSIGVACMRADASDASAAGLIACADAALYQAKKAGRNVVVALDQHAPVQSWPAHAASPEPAEPAQQVDPEREELEKVLTQVDRPWFTLRFPARLEQQFWRDTAEDRGRYFAVCGLVAFVVFNCFLLTDYLLVSDVMMLAIKVRLGLFTPAAAAILFLLWFCRAWVWRTWPPMVVETVVLLSGVGAGASLGYILSASHLPTSQLYHVGLMVVIVYGNLVQRLRFWYALVFSLMVYVIHVVAVLALPVFNERLVVPLATLIGSAVIFSLMANYSLERDQRRRYLLNLIQVRVLKELGEVRLRLQSLSRMDALTGLYNRRHFQEYLGNVWQRAQHDGSDVAIIMMDVDHFKKYNDRYGHQAGDACLAKVAQALQHCMRQPGDLVARFGGEEFIAVLPKANLAMAQAAAERVRQAVQALQIPHADSSAAEMVTASLGVASLAVQPGQIDTALIRSADDALYQSKHAGRNRVSVATGP